jgi:hypothetical protein
MSAFNFRLSTWRAPHWLTVAGSAAAGAVVSYVESAIMGGGFPASAQAWEALAKGAAIAGLAALVGVAKQILSPQAQAASNVIARAQS